MEAALRNLLAVRRFSASTCLFFFSKNQALHALFVTPRICYELRPASGLPLSSESGSMLRFFLATCKVRISVEQRKFELSGKLMGGGGFCGKGTVAEELPQKRSAKWLDILWRISEGETAFKDSLRND